MQQNNGATSSCTNPKLATWKSDLAAVKAKQDSRARHIEHLEELIAEAEKPQAWTPKVGERVVFAGTVDEITKDCGDDSFRVDNEHDSNRFPAAALRPESDYVLRAEHERLLAEAKAEAMKLHYLLGNGLTSVGCTQIGERHFVRIRRLTEQREVGECLLGKGLEDDSYPTIRLEFPNKERALEAAYAIIGKPVPADPAASSDSTPAEPQPDAEPVGYAMEPHEQQTLISLASAWYKAEIGNDSIRALDALRQHVNGMLKERFNRHPAAAPPAVVAPTVKESLVVAPGGVVDFKCAIQQVITMLRRDDKDYWADKLLSAYNQIVTLPEPKQDAIDLAHGILEDIDPPFNSDSDFIRGLAAALIAAAKEGE